MAVKIASATITRKVDFTTALVVERPTESGPPRTRNPSRQPTWAMMVANTTLLIRPVITSCRKIDSIAYRKYNNGASRVLENMNNPPATMPKEVEMTVRHGMDQSSQILWGKH